MPKVSQIEPDECRDSVLVVAHPDDEVLWFSSIVRAVRAVAICYRDVPWQPDWTSGRAAALAAYPEVRVRDLGLAEADVFWHTDWQDPRTTDFGLEVPAGVDDRPRYVDNYDRLFERLGPVLEGAQRVFTHNPWGEYGHPEHVQVFRAVRAWQERLGFELWVSGYFSNKSAILLARSLNLLADEVLSLPTQPAFAGQVAALYRAHACWTWFDDYEWPGSECFVRVATDGEDGVREGALLPLHCLLIAPPPARPPGVKKPPSLRRRVSRSVRRLLD